MREIVLTTIIGLMAIVIAGLYYERADVISLPTEPIELDEYRVTAFCPGPCCCGEFADGITASGHVIQPGDKFVAAPREIPYGTSLEIPGYGIVTVQDRGGSIKGKRLDVFFSSHQEALEWGVRNLKVRQL